MLDSWHYLHRAWIHEQSCSIWRLSLMFGAAKTANAALTPNKLVGFHGLPWLTWSALADIQSVLSFSNFVFFS